MDKTHTWNLAYWAIALLLLPLLQDLWQNAGQAQAVPYSEFEKALGEGRIASVTVAERTIVGRLKTADGNKTTLVAARLDKYDVPYTRVVENTLLKDLLSWIVPAVVFFGLWFFVFRSFADK